MSRFLFVWELGEGLGHVTSIHPVITRLKARGHEVLAAVRNTRSAATVFPADIPILQCPYQNWRAVQSKPITTFAHVLQGIGFNEATALRALISSWRNLIGLWSPDLIIADHSPTALLASSDLGIERVQMGIGFHAPPRTTPLPQIRPGPPIPEAVMLREEEEVLSVTNAGLESAGMARLDRLCDVFAGVDEIMLTYEELDHFGPRTGRRYWGVHSTGAAARGATVSRSGDPQPEVFGYLKMMPGLAETLDALRGLKLPSLVYGPWVDDAARNRFASPTLTLTSEPADISAVAPGCRLAVLNGTHGTTAQMLKSGVPILQIPLYVEQAMVSARSVSIGAALMVDARKKDSVAGAARQLLDNPEYREAAGRFSRRYQSEDSESALAEIVENLESRVR